ncbi:MAG: 23S rRNA (uracil1939-C5)-methyltransferase [Paracoccaceae bacterium]|jgi:23S rRNA (uracil1939-C5)-methyltransferase
MTDAPLIEIEIDRLGHRGDGVGAHDGAEVFAPFTLPGDHIRGALAGGRIDAPEILRASPDRVTAPCPAFGTCGGCSLQHASAPFLAAWTRDQIAEALRARGFADADIEIRETQTSPDRSRRRATLSGRRTKKTSIIGFHERAGTEIVALADDCILLRPEIMAARADLETLVGLTATRNGEVRLAVTVTINGLDIDVTGMRDIDANARMVLARLSRDAAWARLTLDGDPVAENRVPLQRFGRAEVAPPPGGFLQATAEGEAALVAAVREAVGKAPKVADLFCGAGTFALPLAERAEVLAVEGDAALLRAMEAGWRKAGGGLRRIASMQRDLFRRPMLAQELRKVSAVVIDPPRQGAEAQTRALAGAALERIAAVSCNPATFARDARILVDAGWKMLWIQPVDQFRWSPHAELAACFAKE